MSEPKRYDLFVEASLQAEEGGEWVKWDDYADLKKQVERLTKAGDAMAYNIPRLATNQVTAEKAVEMMKAWNAVKEGKQS